MFRECNLAYKSLISNSNIAILKADKGTSFVVLNKVDYLNKMKTVLNEKTKLFELGCVDKFVSTAKTERAYKLKLRNWFTKDFFIKRRI